MSNVIGLLAGGSLGYREWADWCNAQTRRRNCSTRSGNDLQQRCQGQVDDLESRRLCQTDDLRELLMTAVLFPPR